MRSHSLARRPMSLLPPSRDHDPSTIPHLSEFRPFDCAVKRPVAAKSHGSDRRIKDEEVRPGVAEDHRVMFLVEERHKDRIALIDGFFEISELRQPHCLMNESISFDGSP